MLGQIVSLFCSALEWHNGPEHLCRLSHLCLWLTIVQQ